MCKVPGTMTVAAIIGLLAVPAVAARQQALQDPGFEGSGSALSNWTITNYSSGWRIQTTKFRQQASTRKGGVS